MTVIGAGNIGVALVRFRGFGTRGFKVVSIYDNDPYRIGQVWAGLTVRDQKCLEEDLRGEPVDIAILVTPAEAAQRLADRLVAVGVRAILNFAPVQLRTPEGVVVKNVNLALELEALSYGLGNN